MQVAVDLHGAMSLTVERVGLSLASRLEDVLADVDAWSARLLVRFRHAAPRKIAATPDDFT
jgi:hypothetical protein